MLSSTACHGEHVPANAEADFLTLTQSSATFRWSPQACKEPKPKLRTCVAKKKIQNGWKVPQNLAWDGILKVAKSFSANIPSFSGMKSFNSRCKQKRVPDESLLTWLYPFGGNQMTLGDGKSKVTVNPVADRKVS